MTGETNLRFVWVISALRWYLFA